MYREFLETFTPADVAADYIQESAVPAFDPCDAEAIRAMYEQFGYHMPSGARVLNEAMTVEQALHGILYRRKQQREGGEVLPGPFLDASNRLVPGVGLWTAQGD